MKRNTARAPPRVKLAFDIPRGGRGFANGQCHGCGRWGREPFVEEEGQQHAMKIPANEDDSPVIDPGKKDTKTNIMVVIGVAVFLVLTGLLMWFYAANPDDLGDDVHEEYAEPGPQR